MSIDDEALARLRAWVRAEQARRFQPTWHELHKAHIYRALERRRKRIVPCTGGAE